MRPGEEMEMLECKQFQIKESVKCYGQQYRPRSSNYTYSI